MGKFYMKHILSSVQLRWPMLVMSFCSWYFTSYEAKHCYKISNPINCQFWHHSCIWLKVLPPHLVSHPYLIFTNKWDIQHFLFFLTFSCQWEILFETHSQQCWDKLTHAGHVILQLILYNLWSKTLLQAFQLYKLPILTSQLHQAWRATPTFGVISLLYLYK